ncbi:MAG: acyl-CoA thioesterase, partial [Gemmatimonadaceae bacterium]
NTPPALPGDAIVARTWVGTADANRFERHTEILRAADEKVLARARTLWVPISRATGRLTRVSDDVRARFSRPAADA